MTRGSPFLDQLGLDADHKVELSTWQRPATVQLRGGHLVFGPPHDEVVVGSNQAGLLAQFARLAKAADEDVLAFAQKWGALSLCEHGIPLTDRHHPQLRRDDMGACDPPPELTHLGFAVEPISGWRDLAGQATAMLEINDRIKRRLPANPELWEPLRPLFPSGLRLPDDPEPRGRLIDPHTYPGRQGLVGEIRLVIPQLLESRRAVAYAIQRWIDYGDVSLRFNWRAPTPQLTFGGTSLLGALATLLAVSVGGAEGPLLCSHCRLPYTPSRRPRGPRHFCSDCRKGGAPQRYASRDYRARKA